jgi:ABC-2 type transport system permease protein
MPNGALDADEAWIYFMSNPKLPRSGTSNQPTATATTSSASTILIPLRYFLVIPRASFLKGVGLDVFWPEALALLGWGIAILTLATP